MSAASWFSKSRSNFKSLFFYEDTVFENHPLLKNELIEIREYQVNIAKSALRGNTLVVLPTGLGKTVIAIFIIVEVLRRKGGKILFLAPTKPLVEQHVRTLKNLTKVKNIALLTGEIRKNKRKDLVKDAEIVVSTPQVIQNDIQSGDINIGEFTLIVFDEAHKAVGNYAYVYIAKEYAKSREDHLILAMTASPGGSEEKVMEIIENLRIENVEIRTEHDADVRKYVKGIKTRIVTLPMPEELKKLHKALKELYDEIIAELRKYELFLRKKRITRKDLLIAQATVRDRIEEGNTDYYNAAMLLTMAIKVDYAMEYLETQGLEACYEQLQRIITEGNSRDGSRAAKMLVSNARFIQVVRLARELIKNKNSVENPKLDALKVIVRKQLSENPNSRIIVFTHFRETSQIVAEALNKLPGIRAVRFIGQASKGEDKGMNQRKQVEILKKFREGVYNVLVATQVAEEGLDIPSTDMVIFYEPVPSEIRAIQRRGRTGRTDIGKVVILTIKGTRDVAYHWSSKHKERKMKNELRWLRVLLKDRFRNREFRKIFADEPSRSDVDEPTQTKKVEKSIRPERKKQLSLLDFV